MRASGAFGGKSLSQYSQFGRICSAIVGSFVSGTAGYSSGDRSAVVARQAMFLVLLLLAARSNANSRAGVTGYSPMRSPKGASAFSMAETIAPAAGTQPDSPTPLTPSGLSGEGNSASFSSILGTSIDPGSR